MARIANPEEAGELGRRGRPARYPWDMWTDGRTWICDRGTDFVIEPRVFRIVVTAYARKHGLRVSTGTIGSGSVMFRFRHE